MSRGRKKHDVTGVRFGRLVAAVQLATTPTKWLCRCDCGRNHIASLSNLRQGSVMSCGCWRRQVIGRTGSATAASAAIRLATAAAAVPEAGLAGFGSRLRQARAARGMTAQDLAHLLGVSLPTIYNWEQARTYPDLPLAARIAKALEMGPAELAGWKT